jgi:hypothetical protein
MRKHTTFMQLLFAITLLAIVVFIGCEKKTDEMQDEVKSEDALVDTTSSIGQPDMDEPDDEEELIVIPDVTGIWTGTFDGKLTKLKITEQTDSSFSGSITINYKQPLNQTVKGNFYPSTLKISMIDQLHSKFMGKYNGKMSDDYKTFAGKFTKNRDGSQYSFNLEKK